MEILHNNMRLLSKLLIPIVQLPYSKCLKELSTGNIHRNDKARLRKERMYSNNYFDKLDRSGHWRWMKDHLHRKILR